MPAARPHPDADLRHRGRPPAARRRAARLRGHSVAETGRLSRLLSRFYGRHLLGTALVGVCTAAVLLALGGGSRPPPWSPTGWPTSTACSPPPSPATSCWASAPSTPACCQPRPARGPRRRRLAGAAVSLGVGIALAWLWSPPAGAVTGLVAGTLLFAVSTTVGHDAGLRSFDLHLLPGLSDATPALAFSPSSVRWSWSAAAPPQPATSPAEAPPPRLRGGVHPHAGRRRRRSSTTTSPRRSDPRPRGHLQFNGDVDPSAAFVRAGDEGLQVGVTPPASAPSFTGWFAVTSTPIRGPASSTSG